MGTEPKPKKRLFKKPLKIMHEMVRSFEKTPAWLVLRIVRKESGGYVFIRAHTSSAEWGFFAREKGEKSGSIFIFFSCLHTCAIMEYAGLYGSTTEAVCS